MRSPYIYKLIPLLLSALLLAGGVSSCVEKDGGTVDFGLLEDRINSNLCIADTLSAQKDIELMVKSAHSAKEENVSKIYSAIVSSSEIGQIEEIVKDYESSGDWRKNMLYDANSVVRLYVSYSNWLKSCERREEADEAIAKAVKCAYDSGLMDEYAELQCSILRHVEDRGDYDLALSEYNRLLTFCRYHNCKRAQLEVLFRISMCFLCLEDAPTAQVYLDEMQSLSDDSPLSRARYWHGLARISDANADTLLFGRSLDELNELQKFSSEVRFVFSAAISAMQTQYFLMVGQNEHALFAVNKALKAISTPSCYNPPQSFLYVLRAEVMVRKQDLFQAKVMLDSIDPVALRKSNVEIYKYYAFVCSHYYASLGDDYLAYAYARRKSNLADTLEFDAGRENLVYRNLEQRRDTTVVEQQHLLDNVNVERRKLVFFQSLWIAGIVIALVAVFIGYYFISNRRLKSHNYDLERMRDRLTDEVNDRKGKLEVQKAKLDAKNESMRAELSFAKLIQSNILPSEEILSSPGVGDHFVLFIPCNQVSGDFYWFFDSGDKLFVCAADATGHGIPGAMISMVGATLLGDIVSDPQKRVPSRMLESLSVMLIEVLQNNNDIVNADSIDLSLLCIDRETHSYTLSMARHVAYIVRKNGDVAVVQGTKRCIGEIIEVENGRPFEDIELDLHEGDCIYLASDGFVSQFGGPDNVKYKRKRFENLLASIHDKDMAQQKQMLEHNFLEWKGNVDQTDDVLVVGLQIGKL